MSYEGYWQVLCENGHQDSFDCFVKNFQDLKDGACSKCGEKFVWVNSVDLTNGSYDDDGKEIDAILN